MLFVAAALAGCYGAGSTELPGASGPAETSASTQPARIHGVPDRAAVLIGRTWLAEGPRGWEAGQIGGGRTLLPRAEVGISAKDGWIVSAVLRPIGSTTLLVRDGAAGQPRPFDLGALAPSAVVIVADHAYVSGFSFASPADPGILDVDLRTATTRTLLAPSDAPGTRYLAVSPEGSIVVSTLCDLASNPEPTTCSLTVVPLDGSAPRALGSVAGGLLRATSPAVAIVAPQGAEAPTWVAGIDLTTGKELWRTSGGELGPSLMTMGHGLVQQRLRIDGSKPRLVIEAIDVRTGTSRTVYEETAAAPRTLWPALCSETSIALGEDATGSRALAESDGAAAAVRLVSMDGGNVVDVGLELGSRR